VLYHSLETHLRARRPVVVEANFAVEHARPILLRLHERHPFAALEVHCTAPADVLVARYRARSGSRHAGHLDAQRVEEIAAAVAEGRNAALELGGETLVLDTTRLDLVDVQHVVEAARAHVARHARGHERAP
jgi:predicted kinase